MATCEHYQGQLLAHLYDLLEEAERQELQAHLDQCAGCQAALSWEYLETLEQHEQGVNHRH